MPRYVVRSVTTTYDRHVIDAADKRDAFWALMLDEPAPTRRTMTQEVYEITEDDS
jgi:hypothetical protein